MGEDATLEWLEKTLERGDEAVDVFFTRGILLAIFSAISLLS